MSIRIHYGKSHQTHAGQLRIIMFRRKLRKLRLIDLRTACKRRGIVQPPLSVEISPH